jgi:subtilisin family serine protease
MTPSNALFSQQWYLDNTGQNGGTAGKDIDVLGAWNYANGRGVKIVVNDTGIDYTNPDLTANYDAAGSKSADPPTNDGYPYNSDNLSGTALHGLAHGTAVAGLIAADGDGPGLLGVAYGATVAAYRVIDTAAEAQSSFTALGNAFENEISGNFAVANNSWEETTGLADSVFSSDPTVQTAISDMLDAATHGRGGLGTINVFAAGNGYQSGDDTNLHAFQSSINVVTVAALNDNGTVNAPGGRYSNTGASILVSAPGTDMTVDDMVDTPSNTGFASGNTASDLSGTSFAAPLVTGVIALMLEANPNLGLRDVQNILALTARETDPSDASWSINDATDWNGGGMHVSNDYGFGLVDARAAVQLAQTWTLQQTLANRTIDTVAANATGAIVPTGSTFTFSVTSSDLLNLQWVRIQLSLDFQKFNDLEVVLISPEGARSVLLDHPGSGFSNGGTEFNSTVQLSTDQFWGQQSVGTWTLWVGDANPLNNDTGTVSAANLVLVGDAPTASHSYIYTDEYGTMLAQNASRGTLSDTSGASDTINLAATSGTCSVDLATGVCSVDGSPLTIAAGTIVKGVIGGAGTTTLIGNNLGDTLQAGDGVTTLDGGTGNDTLIGGTANDSFAPGAGNNTITGGSAVNTLDYSSAPAAVTVNLTTGTAQNGYGGTDTFTKIQDFKGSAFSDIFIAGPGTHALVGGGGHDTLDLRGASSGYTLASDGNSGVTVTDGTAGRDGTTDLTGFNYVNFTDKTEVVATAQQAAVALLYAAALNRAPDVAGLNAWEDIYASDVSAAAKAAGPFVSLAETPAAGLTSIAAGFLNSQEFQQKYGPLADAQFVTDLYANVLGRAPDQPGLQGWLNALETGGFTREMVLVGFAESNENIAKVSAEWLFQV